MPSESRNVATGESAVSTPSDVYEAEEDATTIEALKAAKPLLVYYYVAGETDPQNDNYKFSSKFEQGGMSTTKVVEMLNDKFVCRKIALPQEADMKQLKNQSRIEIFSVTGLKVGVISRDNWNQLDAAPFQKFCAVRVAKSDQLVKKEIARIEKAIKERAKAEAESTAKNEE